MTINQARFNAVVETAKAKASDSPRWVRAIERAAEALQSGELVVTLLHNGALVTSANGSYFVNGHCACPAAKHGHAECYHRAAVRIVELMEAETIRPALSVRADIIASIKSAWSRVCPTTNLADELMARFRKNSLEMLDTDMLSRVLAAIQ